MPTTTKTIKPQGGGDYSTLTDALVGLILDTNDIVLNCYAGNIGNGSFPDILDDPGLAFNSLTINAINTHVGIKVTNLSTVSYMDQDLDVSTFRPITIRGMTWNGRIDINAASTLLVDKVVFQGGSGTGVFLDNADINGDISTTVQNSAFYASDVTCHAESISGTNRAILTLINNSGNGVIQTNPNAIPTATAVATINATNVASLLNNTNAFKELTGGGGGTETSKINLLNCCYQTKTTSGVNTAPQVSNLATEFTSATNFTSKASTSKIRDNGTSTGAPSVDIIGVARPQNGFWDIGAFEFAPAGSRTLYCPSINSTFAMRLGFSKVSTEFSPTAAALVAFSTYFGY